MNPEYIMKRPEQQDDDPASGCHHYPHKKARRFRLMHRGLTTSIQWLGETTTSVADTMLERVFTTCGPLAGPDDDDEEFEGDDDNNTIQVKWHPMSHEEGSSKTSSSSSSSSSNPTEQQQESTAAAKDMSLPTPPPKLTLSVRPTKKVPSSSQEPTNTTTTTTTSAFSAFILPANEEMPSAPPHQGRPMLKQVSSPHKKEKSTFSSSSMMFVSTPNKTVGPSTTTTTAAASPDKIAYGGFLAPNPKDTPTKNRRGRNPFHPTTTMLYSSPAAAASTAKVYRPFAIRSPTTPHLVGEQANGTMSSQSMTLGGNTPWKRFHC